MNGSVPRREFLRHMGLGAVVLLSAACSTAAPPAAAPTAAPAAPQSTRPAGAAATSAPAAPAATTAAVPAATTAAAAPVKATWNIVFHEEADSIDPPQSAAQGSQVLQSQFLEPLMDFEGPDSKAVGVLAEKWEVPNPTTWRFTIRSGVKFHDGSPMTVQDVKYSYELHMNPSSKRHTYAKDIKSVDIKDDRTVDVVTLSPLAAFPINQTRLLIVSKDAREKAGAAFADKPIGTGPYRVVSYNKDQALVLEANPNYWRGKVQPQNLRIRVITEASTRVAELKSGGADIVSQPPIAQLAEIDKDPALQSVPIKGGRMIIYQFNTTEKPFDDVRVRQAMNYAVNREAIVKQILLGNGVVMPSVVVQGFMGYGANVQPYPYDPAKAKQLLTEAGYPNGFDTTFTISSGVFLRDQEIAEAIASQLGQVGVKVTLVPTERAKIQADALAGNFKGISSLAWGVVFDPAAMMSSDYMKKSFTSPEMQRLIKVGNEEPDLAKRTAAYEEVQRIAKDYAPWLFTHAQDELWAKRKDVPWQPFSIRGSLSYTRLYQLNA